jgi:hypothetical protein
MERPRIKLDCIRVQTARMMEIYALLQGEIGKNADLGLTAQTRAQLDHAIATIHANMRQLQELLAAYQEENSPEAEEARELEEILEAVLQWHYAEGE